jgi:hypothetical protein
MEFLFHVPIFLIFALISVAILAISFTASSKAMKHQQAVFESLANELGLKLIGGDPLFPGIKILAAVRHPMKIEGMASGKPVLIQHYTVGSGKNRTTYHECALTIQNPSGFDLTLSAENTLSKVGKSLGMKEVETGNRAFDDAFLIRTKQMDLAKVALFPEIQEKLLAWHQHYPRHGTIKCEGNRLRYYQAGTIDKSEKTPVIREVLPILTLLAEIIDQLPVA